MPTALRNELKKLEEDMPKLEDKIAELKKLLALETTDYHRILELQKEIDDNDQLLNQYMERYFELEEIKNQYTI